MLKDLKAPQKDSTAWCSQSDRLQMAEDTLSAVRRLRREVVDCMRILMKNAKDKKPMGMFAIVEEMLKKTKCLCSLMDMSTVEEVFTFLEDNRITHRPEKDEFSESVAEFMQRNKLKIDLPLFRPNKFDSLQTPCSEFVSKELRTPEVDIFSPSDPEMAEFWRSYSAYTSGYQSVDKLSDIDEFEESFKYLSVIDKTKHYYTLCRTGSPIDTPVATPQLTPKRAAVSEEEDVKKEEVDDDIDEGIEQEEVLEVTTDVESTSPPKIAQSEVVIPEQLGEILEDKEEELGEEDDTVAQDDVETEVDIRLSTSPEVQVNQSEEVVESEHEVESETKEETKAEGEDEKKAEEEEEKQKKADQGLTSDSPNGLHYRAGDEPEPMDLTHLNIEAAMMCLASKVRLICGKANSPTLSSRTFRFKELDANRANFGFGLRNGANALPEETSTPPPSNKLSTTGIPKSASHESAFKIPDVPNPTREEEKIVDWAAELRPSMRKLRQGMDSLCKTSRLVCSVLRLQQLREAVNLSHDIKYRRDVCFSQALTSLVTALMARFWAVEPDPIFLQLCANLGPLASFESLLSLHGEDVSIFNDMLVAVEDLRNVEFTLILVDKRTKAKIRKSKEALAVAATTNGSSKNNTGSTMPILQYHSFPLPRVTGSRSSLKVMLPVPDYVYTMLPLEQIKTMTFSVTPLFFNVGINEHATIAGKFGNNGPQEKNNIDNFKTLSDYYRRFKKLKLPTTPLCSRNKRKQIRLFSLKEKLLKISLYRNFHVLERTGN